MKTNNLKVSYLDAGKIVGLLAVFFIGAQRNVMAVIHPYFNIGFGNSSGNENVYQAFVGSAEFGIQKRFGGIGLHIARLQQATKPDILRQGTLSMMPIMLNLYGNIPITHSLKAHMGGGVCYVVMNRILDEKETKVFNLTGYDFDESIDNGMGFQIMGGLEYLITKKISIGIDLMQIFFDTKIRTRKTNKNTFREQGRTIEDEGIIQMNNIFGLAYARLYF